MAIKKNYTKEVFKNKSDWLSHRGLSGTSASAITGSSNWKNILELYADIMVPSNEDVSVETISEPLSYGIQCEPLIRKQFAIDFKKYKVHTPRGQEMYRRKDKTYMTATLDSILTEIDTKRRGIHEIKTHDIKNREDAAEWQDQLPQKYYEQVIWYFVVMNDMEFAEVTAKLRFYDYFDPEGKKLLKTETRYYHIERSEVLEHISALEKRVTRFWEKNVKEGIIPDIKITF